MTAVGPPRTKPKGLDWPWVPRLLKYGAAFSAWVYRRTNGRVMGT